MNVIYVNAEEVVELRSLPPLSRRLVRILLDGFEKAAPLSVAVFRYEPGQKGPSHSHEGSTKTRITIRGEGVVEVGSESYKVPAMSVLHIPQGAIHRPSNLSKEDWVFLAVFVPPIDFGELKKWFVLPAGDSTPRS
ncbi:cupin domain-containing protein [Candidatus Caldatribacterium sp. SIUC1]|uniref:cupin domain-containing protein n=1 Tax=Candidatus Caldatribacterium sp. SIUC1 TaxID=3418365 RepID=UPI003F68F384